MWPTLGDLTRLPQRQRVSAAPRPCCGGRRGLLSSSTPRRAFVHRQGSATASHIRTGGGLPHEALSLSRCASAWLRMSTLRRRPLVSQAAAVSCGGRLRARSRGDVAFGCSAELHGLVGAGEPRADDQHGIDRDAVPRFRRTA